MTTGSTSSAASPGCCGSGCAPRCTAPPHRSRWSPGRRPASRCRSPTGSPRPYSETEAGQEWGPPWGTTWFRVTGDRPRRVGRPRASRRSSTSASRRPARLPGRGAGPPAGRHAGQGAQPAEHLACRWPTGAAGGEQVDLYVEAASNPDIHSAGFGHPAGRRADRRRRARSTAYDRVDLAVLDAEVWELRAGPRGARRADARARRPTTPRRWRDPARPGARRSTSSTWTTSPAPPPRPARCSRPALAAPGPRQRAPGQRGRPRAHRLGVAVAAARDGPQGRPHLLQRHRADGRPPGVRLRHVLRPSSTPGSRSTGPQVWERMLEKVADRAVGAGRRHVGGVRHATCPAARRWPASSCTASGSSSTSSASRPRRCGCPTPSATPPRYPQLVDAGRRRGGSSPRRSPGTRPTSSRTTPSGGRASTAPGSSPTSRRSTPTTPSFSGEEMAHAVRNFAEKGARQPVAGAVRLRRRRRRPHPRDAGAGRAGCATWRARPGSRSRPRRRSSPRPARSTRTRRCGSASCTWSCTAARTPRQADTKQGNRRSEHLLREAELWAATAAVPHRATRTRTSELDRLWKTVLLHQFHDILPGSSIAWVHREARDDLRRGSRGELEAIIGAAQRALAGDPDAGSSVVFNAAPHDARRRRRPAARRSRPARSPATAPVHADGRRATCSTTAWCGSRSTAAACSPPWSTSAPAARRSPPARPATCCSCTPTCPTSGTPGTSTGTTRHGHRPRRRRHDGAAAGRRRGRPRSGSCAASARSELDPGGVARTRAPAGSTSTPRSTGTRSRSSSRPAFPLDVRAERSSSEIQFGHVHRATHTNTSWEAARFEICAHRWLHVGEPGYGVALVNDSTYGHDVTRTVRPDGGTTTTVRLSLLRAPRFPDPETDQGTHRLRYALVAGADLLDATREGYWLNLPERRRARRRRGRAAGDRGPRRRRGLGGEAGRRAARAATWWSGSTRRSAPGPAAASASGSRSSPVTMTDLLERPSDDGRLALHDGGVELTLRPFQVLTLRLTRPRS